ncbi:MAG: TldD/PmbA family protein [Gemmatimonadales bacterium]
MFDEITDALRASRAEFTEIRVERTWMTTVAFRGRRLETATQGVDQGAFIRCYARGRGWGIVSTTDLERIDAAVARAYELSLAVPVDRSPLLAPLPPSRSDGLATLDDDPRAMPLAEKRALAEGLNVGLLTADRRVSESYLAARDEVTEMWVGNSEGTLVRDVRIDAAVAAVAVASDEGLDERAVRSWAARGGWKNIGDLSDEIGGLATRAIERLGARRIRPGVLPVVLGPGAAGALLHAAIGHGLEASDGISALRLGDRVGSALLSVGDDGRGGGLRGAGNWDAEGSPTQSTTLVQHGVVVARLHGRESAARSGEAPTGNARANSFRHAPRPRMTDLFLATGQGTLADLLSGITVGVYVADARGVDFNGGRIRMTAEDARMIRGGEIAEPVEDVVVRGAAADLLQAVDGIAADFAWSRAASACTNGCDGLVNVGDGAPHVRIRAARVDGEGG